MPTVPDDVAAAVKRALQAIESASTGRVSVPELAVTPISLPELRLPRPGNGAARDRRSGARTPTVRGGDAVHRADRSDHRLVSVAAVAPPAPASSGFAPPTPDMRAEAVYRASDAPRHSVPMPTIDGAEPTEPVVFVDDEPEPEPNGVGPCGA